MRSIRAGTLILTIAGLVDAQNRRLLTNFDWRSNQDLASTGMGEGMDTAFIDKVCTGVRIEADGEYGNEFHAAINVLTNATMHWEDYMAGPGVNGDPDFNHAKFPWSTVSGKCKVLLLSTWVTNRDVVYGAWTDNTDSLNSQRMPVSIYLLTPRSTMTTSEIPLLSLFADTLDYMKQLLDGARPQPEAEAFVNSMEWITESHFRRHLSITPVDKCTQTRFTAVSATRTIIATESFTLSRYNFALRAYNNGRWWTKDGGQYTQWVNIWKVGTGRHEWVDNSYRNEEWETVYSSEGYYRVEGPAKLTPGGMINLQLESQELPPEKCHER
jgi:hypothetical protein